MHPHRKGVSRNILSLFFMLETSVLDSEILTKSLVDYQLNL